MLERPLDEERRVGDVLDRPRGGEVAIGVAVQEALAVVRRDDDQRPVVEALLVQAAQQRAEQAVGKAGLEQMALIGLLKQVLVVPGGLSVSPGITSCGCFR